MRYILTIIIFAFSLQLTFSQSGNRIDLLNQQLDSVSVRSTGLNDNLNASIDLNQVSLSNFLLAISNVHKINLNISPELSQIKLSNNFSNVTVKNVLLFLCKEYSLNIEFTGDILSIKSFQPEVIDQSYPIKIDYNPNLDFIGIDVRSNELYKVFKEIMDSSAKNLMFAPGMENLKLTFYNNAASFDAAMQKLALANNLELTKTKDNFYVFDQREIKEPSNTRRLRNRINPNLEFKVLNKTNKLLEVDFKGAQISEVIQSIADSLDIDIFLASPLKEAGSVTLKTKTISFDQLLVKMFEPQITTEGVQKSSGTNVSSSNRNNIQTVSQPETAHYTFKKEGNIYYFGRSDQLSVRKVEIITLRHRSVNLMSDPQSAMASNNIRENYNVANQGFRNQINFNTNSNFTRPQNQNYTSTTANVDQLEERNVLDIIPQEIKRGLDFKVDYELNSIYVTGASSRIEFFKDFVAKIDKTIPVILIEVMIVEAQISNTLETGVSWGIGNEPTTTSGNLFPTTDLTLGAKTINKIINGFSSTSVFNFGQVVPNFFATVKAMETNGDLKIKSTPKLATLNGHKASFSNGQTSYYAIVQRNIIGTDNPQTSEIRNYFPIDAKLGLDIRPYVTGDKQVLLDINVIQSSFGQRIAEDAPPDINSRNFSSVVRMKDQDIAVLGGLEENFKNNSGSGVPFLARIPIIKWLFSKRVREGRKSKLAVFIKPTVIY